MKNKENNLVIFFRKIGKSIKEFFSWAKGSSKSILLIILGTFLMIGTAITSCAMFYLDESNLAGIHITTASSEEIYGNRVFSNTYFDDGYGNQNVEELVEFRSDLRKEYDGYKIFNFLGTVPNDNFNSATCLIPGETAARPIAIFETTTSFNEDGTNSKYYFYQNLRTIAGLLDSSIRENENAIVVSRKYAEDYLDHAYPDAKSYIYADALHKTVIISANRTDETSEERTFEIVGIVDSNYQAANNDGKLYQKYFGDYFFLTSMSGIRFFDNLSLYTEYKNYPSNNGACALEILNFAKNHGMNFAFALKSLNTGEVIENNILSNIEKIVYFESSFIRYFVLVVSSLATISLSLFLLIMLNNQLMKTDLKNKFDKRIVLSLLGLEIVFFFLYIFGVLIAKIFNNAALFYVFPGPSLFFVLFILGLNFGIEILVYYFATRRAKLENFK